MTPEALRGQKKKEREGKPVVIGGGSFVQLRYGKGGRLENDVLATRLAGEVGGLSGFKSKVPFSTFFDGKRYKHPKDTLFGAYASSVKRK